MDDVISLVQGDPYRQHQVFDGTVHALKWLLLSSQERALKLGEREKLQAGEGDLDLRQGGPGVDPGHRGSDSHPPIEEAQGDPHPGGSLCRPLQDGPKGLRTIGCETPLHAPCGTRSSGAPL